MVLYIAGTGRSGSTLLSKLLDTVPGTFAAGEVRFLWEWAIREGRPCSCGADIEQCPVWSAVLLRAYGGANTPLPRGHELASRFLRYRQLPRLLRSVRTGSGAAWHLDEVGRLFRAMADISGASVVVDSSKLPTFGYLLSRAAAIDLRVVHLVRDPRATAWSWMRSNQRHGRRAGEPRMDEFSALKTALVWNASNAVASALLSRPRRRYLSVRYEDLVQDPCAVLERILRFIGRPDAALPVRLDGSATVVRGHLIAGNPIRYGEGDIAVREDDEWKREMPRIDRMLVTALTAPGLVTARYPLRRDR